MKPSRPESLTFATVFTWYVAVMVVLWVAGWWDSHPVRTILFGFGSSAVAAKIVRTHFEARAQRGGAR